MHNTAGNEVVRPPDINAVTSASGVNSEDVADMAARTLVDSREGWSSHNSGVDEADL